MKRKNWKVAENDPWPADCWFCKNKIGDEHARNCNRRSRTVVVKFDVCMVVAVPESWSESTIDRFYNDSRWLDGDFVRVLEERRRKVGRLSDVVEAMYLLEATESDEAEWGCVYVNDIKA